MSLVYQVLLDLLDFKVSLDFLDRLGFQVTHLQIHMVPKASPEPKGTLGSPGIFIQDYLVLMGIPVIQDILVIEDRLDPLKTQLTRSPRASRE